MQPEDNDNDWGSKFTLIVTPHDDYRYPYLLRFLKYYKSYNFPFNIIILNSCSSDIDKQFNSYLKEKSISHYKFNHDERFENKLLFGISKVTTDYCAICSEDDFITTNGINESINFLINHPDYSAALGKSFLFTVENSNTTHPIKKIHYKSTYNSAHSIEFDDPSARLTHYISNYNIPVFFSIYRTNTLKTIWEKTLANTNDYRFGELLPALLTVIYGKFKILDVLYIAREYILFSKGQTLTGYIDFIENDTFQEKYFKFRKCLSEALENVSKIRSNKAKSIINKGMKSFLGYSWETYKIRHKFISYLKIIGFNKFIITLRKIVQKSILTKPIKNDLDFPYQSVNHPDYEEWKRINHIISTIN